MMKAIRNSSKLLMLVLVVMISISGCKSKKKQMEAAAAEKARLEQEQAALRKQEEEQRRKEAEEKARREAEARALQAQANEPRARLNQYFESIANSGSTGSANSSITEALALFASPQTPVLIVISEEAGQKDYDRPTTIIDYLNYLKDQKKNPNKISNVQVDGSGKITELELRKN
jgi:flagellar motor protein MotB